MDIINSKSFWLPEIVCSFHHIYLSILSPYSRLFCSLVMHESLRFIINLWTVIVEELHKRLICLAYIYQLYNNKNDIPLPNAIEWLPPGCGLGVGCIQEYNISLISDNTNKDVVSDWPLVVNILCNFTWLRSAHVLMNHFTRVHKNPKPRNYKFLAQSKFY